MREKENKSEGCYQSPWVVSRVVMRVRLFLIINAMSNPSSKAIVSADMLEHAIYFYLCEEKWRIVSDFSDRKAMYPRRYL